MYCRILRVCVLVTGLVAVGCDDGSTLPAQTTAGTPAPQRDVEACQTACNKLKFFECNDSVEHANCFSSCADATSAAIATFSACVEADICDASCIANLRAATPDTVAPDPSACVAQCAAFADACVPEIASQCEAECGGLTSDEAALVVYCLGHRNGCALPASCQDEMSL